MDAYVGGQQARKNNDLLSARAALTKCAAAECPGMVQSDCNAWLAQVVESIPSVLLDAKIGNDNVLDVSVTMDGAPLAAQLDGKPIEVNPGLHTFVFQRAGAEPIEKKVLVVDRNRGQLVSALWPAPAAPHPAGPTNEEAPRLVRPIPVLSYVLGGVAIAGLGTFGVLAIAGKSTQSNLESTCEPHCSSDQVNSLETQFIAADVAAGVGALAAAGAVITFLARPSKEERAPASSAAVVPVAGGAALMWTGSF
jgi:hypothetical protein